MKITYIAHSGFLVETDRNLLLFDYYRGDMPALAPDKPLYVFASHRHQDHFNPEIFRLTGTHPRVKYLLSYDIKVTPRNLKKWGIDESWQDRILSLRAEEEYRIEDALRVETLKSTDEGVAFLVTDGTESIFHAGDLNWWYWEGESKSWLGTMETGFKREVAKLAGRAIDLAFLPLDDRQGTAFFKGMDWYLRNCRIRYAFPMHFWEDGSVIERFEQLECRKDYADTVICDTAHEKKWEL